MRSAVAKLVSETKVRNNVESGVNKNESTFSCDVINGLLAPEKSISPKYFYDDKGSALFDDICNLDEYYPYKTELKLLPRVAQELGSMLLGNYSVVEFGAGSLLKIKPLLENIKGIQQFIPIDISGNHLRNSCELLAQEYPSIDVKPIEADFCEPVALGELSGKPLGFFPGSTIGNFLPNDAVKFLANARKTVGRGGYMLVGVDTKKSPQTLHRAYNDKAGVTARFNLNVLTRINRELEADFDIDLFEHYAHYDADAGCIKMHLISLVHQQVELMGENIEFAKGEAIHTESSYKYRPEDFAAMASRAGWSVVKTWLAEGDMFSTFLLEG